MISIDEIGRSATGIAPVPASTLQLMAGEQLSVLVLDDERAVAQTIATMAASIGADARFACTADAFFAEFERQPADVVIIDLQMPEHDGLEVMRELGSRHRVRAVLSSGCDARVLETARHSARNYGLEVIGVLPKPVRRSALRNLLHDVQSFAARENTRSGRSGKPLLTAPMLAHAIASGQIIPHFQPKIRLSDATPSGFEALARWVHPEFGTIQPDEFIPLAAEAGLDAALTEVMLDQSLANLASLGNPDLTVAINVPMRICADPGFLTLLASLLKRHRLCAANLILEVTEAGPNGVSHAQIDALTRLRLNGYSLSIDDFGTGVSSLERLVRIPFDELKIDRYFARDISISPSAKGVVRNLVRMAKTLGMSVTIEGIEDATSMKMSGALGCDNVQGYYIAKPMPAADTQGWLLAHAEQGWPSLPDAV